MLRSTRTILILVLLAASVKIAPAQHSHTHTEEQTHHDHLHFLHPLVTESPSPDAKIRVNHFFRTLDEEEAERTGNTVSVGAEYALHRSVSIEVGAPFVFLDPEMQSSTSRLGNLEVALKFANFAFEQKGLLLGYGLETGLPTGDEEDGIGSDHIVEFEPFFNVAYQRGRLQTVVFASYGIPTNQDPGEEIETEFGYDVSVMYLVSDRVQGLIELGGETVLSGPEDEFVANLAPGLRIRPVASRPFVIGAGVNVPVTDDRGFDVRTVLSLFYHF